MKGVPGTEYISKITSHGYTYYNVQKTVNGKYCFFGSGKTLIQALMIRDYCEYNGWVEKYPKQFKCNEKYINRRNSGTYVVEKSINGKMRYYGGFDNLEDAKKFRDFCIKKGWSSNYRYKNPMKNIQKRHGNYMVICYVNGKNQYVGTFKSLEHAIEIRDLFFKYNGEWNDIVEHDTGERAWLNGKQSTRIFFEKYDGHGPKDFFIAKHSGLLFVGDE